MPVVTATAQRADMDLYLTGLGTVTAYNVVTIRSRADGELIKVAFSEGQTVREGQLLAEIDPRQYQVQLAQAQGQLARDQALLKSARLDLERYTNLLKSKTVTQQQVEQQAAIVDQSLGTVKSDQAQIESAKLQLSYCRITAPISGRIGLRTIDRGNIIHANDANGLAVITQLQPIAVLFTIPQDDIPRVQKKLSTDASPLVEAYDRDLKVKLASGTLAAIDNQVDPTSGTVRLKAEFENADQELFPNQFVNARLLVDTKHDATIIPAAAVQHGPNSTFVYVIKPDSTAELRTVTVGPTEGDQTVIEEGLAPGELVVTEGLDKLKPQAKVAMRESGARDNRGASDSGETVRPRP